MPGTNKRGIVIDADVARASGQAASVGTPAACREVLSAVIYVCHHLVLSDELCAEWRHNESRYARTWLTTMQQKRGKVRRIGPVSGSNDDAAILDALESAAQRERARKDLHLLATARHEQADQLIVSRDRRARADFCVASESVTELRKVMWVSVDDFDLQAIVEWLKKGAKRRDDFLLKPPSGDPPRPRRSNL